MKVYANSIAIVQMFKCMLQGPFTTRELEQEAGLHDGTCRRYVWMMRKEKLAHITGWERDAAGRPSIPVYVLGEGKDARRPRLTPAQRAARYRQRRKERAAGGGQRIHRSSKAESVKNGGNSDAAVFTGFASTVVAPASLAPHLSA